MPALAKTFLLLKSHPMLFPGAGSAAQARAGNYRKRKVKWNGLTISVENEAGTVRRGRAPDGTEWHVWMFFPYGYIKLTEGVDGDHVDCYLGPNMSAPMVYVVHQRRYGDWENYDEDKAMIGFDSEDDARHAFLAQYDDHRFLGDITAMPVAEFVKKAKATKRAPAMIKAVLFLKSHVNPYERDGKMVTGYDKRTPLKMSDEEKRAADRRESDRYVEKQERWIDRHERSAKQAKNPEIAEGYRQAASAYRAAVSAYRAGDHDRADKLFDDAAKKTQEMTRKDVSFKWGERSEFDD